MALGSAALALKVAGLVSVLALLVVPSLGRCGHPPAPPLPPPPLSMPPPTTPLPPTPAPALAPGPTISCDDCYSQCSTQCDTFVHEACSDDCDVGRNCEDDCVAGEIELCKANDCYKDGTCSCNLDRSSFSGCSHQCSPMRCMTCEGAVGRQCKDDCSKQCSAPNCIPRSPEN